MIAQLNISFSVAGAQHAAPELARTLTALFGVQFLKKD